MTKEDKREWKIEIDGEQADVTLDNNYEAEIKGKGFKNDHLRVSRIELQSNEISSTFVHFSTKSYQRWFEHISAGRALVKQSIVNKLYL